MNLNEAIKTLKNAGFELLKEDAEGSNFLCYGIYGDRAHNDPETAQIYALTKNKQEVIDAICDWFSAGPDDIFFCGVTIVDDRDAEKLNRLGKEDLADTPACQQLMQFVPKNVLEYSGDYAMDLYDENDEEGSMRKLRRMVTREVNAL